MAPFVPSPGDMRFEITRGWKGEPPPPHPDGALVLWVKKASGKITKKTEKPDCPHQGYAVIMESRSDWLKKHSGGNAKELRVCECVGRLVDSAVTESEER